MRNRDRRITAAVAVTATIAMVAAVWSFSPNPDGEPTVADDLADSIPAPELLNRIELYLDRESDRRDLTTPEPTEEPDEESTEEPTEEPTDATEPSTPPETTDTASDEPSASPSDAPTADATSDPSTGQQDQSPRDDDRSTGASRDSERSTPDENRGPISPNIDRPTQPGPGGPAPDPTPSPAPAPDSNLKPSPSPAPSPSPSPVPRPSPSPSPAPSPEPAPAPSPVPRPSPSPSPAPSPEPAPAPSPVPRPSPSPSPAPSPEPAPAPRPGGKPGASNTGVPSGTKLTVHNGDLRITEPGTVIDGLEINGFVMVMAKDVTIRNSIIRGGPAGGSDALVRSASDSASLHIYDSELVAANPNPKIDGLRGWNITAQRLNIHGVIDGAHFWGNNVRLESSWIHSTLHYKDDPHHSDGSHDDGIQIQTGTNIRIIGNTITDAHNAAIMITQDRGRTSDVQIRGNWLNGGRCTINLSEKGRGPFNQISIADNTFGRDVHNAQGRDCAVISPDSSPISFSNNLYEDGSPAALRRG